MDKNVTKYSRTISVLALGAVMGSALTAAVIFMAPTPANSAKAGGFTSLFAQNICLNIGKSEKLYLQLCLNNND